MTTVHEVLGALRSVRDPELDQDLVELGFVTEVILDGPAVTARPRLPTYFCAPNFAYLMVADARAAIGALPGVGAVRIQLEDHFTAEEINDAVGRGEGFVAAFPGEAQAELDDLRVLFQRKALAARQSRVCDALLAAGRTHAELAALRLGELGHDPDAERCRALRRALGMGTGDDAPALVTGDGAPLAAAEIPRFLRLGRLVSTSLEGNAGLCRGLLRTRYGLPDPEEIAA